MVNPRHRHKLIEGLVIAMGKPSKSSSKPPAMMSSKDDDGDMGGGDEPDEGSPAEESQDEDEGVKCAKDAARALGMGDIDDEKARAFAEAIRTIAGGYSK